MVGHRTVHLHVIARSDDKPATKRHPHRADIVDGNSPGADHAAGGLHADELAAAERLDRVREDLGVGVAVLIAEHDDRLLPDGVDHAVVGIAGAAAAGHGDRMPRLRECRQEQVGGESAAVVADVDHEPIFAVAHPIELVLKVVEAWQVHAADMQVAKAAVTLLVDHRPVVFKPGFVEQVASLAVADGAKGDLERFVTLVGGPPHLHRNVAVEPSVEQLREIHRRIDRGAINRLDAIPGQQAAVHPVCRATRQHIPHQQARPRIIGYKPHAEVRGLLSPGLAAAGGLSAGIKPVVRAIELAQHQLDDAAERGHIACLLGHRDVLAADVGPDAAAESLVIPAVSHRLPGDHEGIAEPLPLGDFLSGREAGSRDLAAIIDEHRHAVDQAENALGGLGPAGLTDAFADQLLRLELIRKADGVGRRLLVDVGMKGELRFLANPKQPPFPCLGHREPSHPLADAVEVDARRRRRGVVGRVSIVVFLIIGGAVACLVVVAIGRVGLLLALGFRPAPRLLHLFQGLGEASVAGGPLRFISLQVDVVDVTFGVDATGGEGQQRAVGRKPWRVVVVGMLRDVDCGAAGVGRANPDLAVEVVVTFSKRHPRSTRRDVVVGRAETVGNGDRGGIVAAVEGQPHELAPAADEVERAAIRGQPQVRLHRRIVGQLRPVQLARLPPVAFCAGPLCLPDVDLVVAAGSDKQP